MGYTHYWTFKQPKKGTIRETERLFQRAVADCQLICRAWRDEHKGTMNSISGFSAHATTGKYGGLHVNGKGELAHEDFIIRETFKLNFREESTNIGIPSGFNFCKTAQKPYDTVVVACLIVLKHYLKDLIEVSSDGDASDWLDGLNFASRVLKTKFSNPLGRGLRLEVNEAS